MLLSLCSLRGVFGDESVFSASERDLEFAVTEEMCRIAADEEGFVVKWACTASMRVLVSCLRRVFWWSRLSCLVGSLWLVKWDMVGSGGEAIVRGSGNSVYLP